MLVTRAVCSDTVFIFGLVVNSSIVLSPFSPVEPNGQWFPEKHDWYHHDSDDNKSHLNVVLVRKHVHIVVHGGVCSVVVHMANQQLWVWGIVLEQHHPDQQ